MTAGIDSAPGSWSAAPPTFTRGSHKAELVIAYYGGPPNRTVFLGTPPPAPNPMNDADILKRLGSVETALAEVRVDVGVLKTQMSHVATKAWILSGVIIVLLSVLGGFWWIAQQFLAPILKQLSGVAT